VAQYALRPASVSFKSRLVAIASIALGAGANTAILQLLDAVCLRALPVKALQELVELQEIALNSGPATLLQETGKIGAAERITVVRSVTDRVYLLSGEP
jgi:hypothetical protein